MSNPRAFASKLLVATILLGVTFAAQSATIRVSQESIAGAGDFDSNVLGFVDSYSSSLTASGYYGYNTNFAASFDDGAQDVTLTANKSHVFFVDGADGLSAFFVHDKPVDRSDGGALMTLDLVGDGASVLVRDDNEATGLPSGPNHFEMNRAWSGCCTDGFVIGALDDNWSLFAEFDALTARGRTWNDFDGWWVFDGATSIDLASDLDRRVRFDLAPVPLPAAVWLFGSALIGFIGIARRRTPA